MFLKDKMLVNGEKHHLPHIIFCWICTHFIQQITKYILDVIIYIIIKILINKSTSVKIIMSLTIMIFYLNFNMLIKIKKIANKDINND